ncbi:Glycosyl transferase, group 1 family protein [Flavobacterium limnosediminis JC2902]|uniref:Glycosyl transferase, group 1 family protein n=1 Tax=Flavobacterium limnosediminis JC2902 TaxID=1341181 RepID=V6SH89_9FLAO|nr:Glycosyl transferase, group 1 family protein [Flavobacterium limnosediminis JC2902]
MVYGQKEEGVFQDNGIVIQRIKNVKIKGLSWYFTRKKIEKIINLLYQEKQIDLIEAPDWTGITSFIQPKKCPVVIRLNGSDTYFCHLDERPVKWWNRFHEKKALLRADGHISVSQFTAIKTNELFGLQIPFTIIPNGINPENFQISNTMEPETKTILYFGTLIRKKGLLELPHIFNEVVVKQPDAKLILVGRDSSDVVSGNGSTWKMMQKLFSEEALKQVQYIGGVPYEEVRGHIAKATVCVFPSFAEALPVSWLEAMAMKKAIVASDIGWGPEVISDGKEGLLVDPKSHQDYANAILKLLINQECNKRIGENACAKVAKTFANTKIASQSIAFYQKVTVK